MHRFLGIALSATLLSACEIEPTPRRYYSARPPAETELRLAQEEIRDRVRALGPALDRGDLGDALLALAPSADVSFMGPEQEVPVQGVEEMTRVLQGLVGEEPPTVRMREVRVTMGPRARVAWFEGGMEVERPGLEGAASLLRITGVYLRTRGNWQLVQAHLSRPFTPPAAPQDSVAPPDSAAPGGA